MRIYIYIYINISFKNKMQRPACRRAARRRAAEPLHFLCISSYQCPLDALDRYKDFKASKHKHDHYL